MTQFKVLKYGNPTLREKSVEIAPNTAKLESFCECLLDTMYGFEGIGLAAPQVGILKRIIAVDVEDLEEQPVIFEKFIVDGESYELEFPLLLINPVITNAVGDFEYPFDGCLSIPGLDSLATHRKIKINVEALSIDGEKIEIIGAEGILSVCIQHEIDHLDGILFVDRLVNKNLNESDILAAVDSMEENLEYTKKMKKLKLVDAASKYSSL